VWPTALELKETLKMTKWFNSLVGPQRTAFYIACAIAALVLPLIVQQAGSGWVRILDVALLYILLSLGLNIVVGNAGLLMPWEPTSMRYWLRRI
jgi:hypothetical protein